MDDTKAKRPVSFDELYPGRFLKAGLLGDKKPTLTIRDVLVEELEGSDGVKKKAILYFRETDLGLVACKTNGLCVRQMFGAKVQEWVGKRITLFATEFNGEPCIRVWGSPDIAEDMSVEISLPKRKPFRMQLRRTDTRRRATPDQAPAAEPAREPGGEG